MDDLKSIFTEKIIKNNSYLNFGTTGPCSSSPFGFAHECFFRGYLQTYRVDAMFQFNLSDIF